MPKKYIASITVVVKDIVIDRYDIKVADRAEALSHCYDETLKETGSTGHYLSEMRLNREDD